jgi:hypothetical protein
VEVESEPVVAVRKLVVAASELAEEESEQVVVGSEQVEEESKQVVVGI